MGSEEEGEKWKITAIPYEIETTSLVRQQPRRRSVFNATSYIHRLCLETRYHVYKSNIWYPNTQVKGVLRV